MVNVPNLDNTFPGLHIGAAYLQGGRHDIEVRFAHDGVFLANPARTHIEVDMAGLSIQYWYNDPTTGRVVYHFG